MTIKKQKAPQKKAAVAVALPKSKKPAGVGMGMAKGMAAKVGHRGGNLGKFLHPAKGSIKAKG